MKYLVVWNSQRDNLCKLQVVDEDTPVIARAVWALKTGEQILYVQNRLQSDMKQWHLGGTYESGAQYVMDIDDMIAVLKSRLGPTDEERYLAALEHRQEGQDDFDHTDGLWTFLAGTFGLIWALIKGTGKILMYIVGTLLFIRWTKKR